MPASFKHMDRYRKDFSILSNLSNKNATQGHWGTTTWMTSADVTATLGKKFQNSVSVDQLAARVLGRDTRFTSLALAAPREGANSGCYGPGLSLRGPTPATRSRAKRARLVFSTDSSARAKFRSKNAGSCSPNAAVFLTRSCTSEQSKLTYDFIVAAIQTDMTRAITYRQPTAGLLPELGFKVDGHKTTHTRKGLEPYNAALARDQKQLELVAYLIDKLKTIKDVDGSSVFDNSLIAYGGGITINHDVRDTPATVAGHGGGDLNQGQHHRYESNLTPLANLWYSFLNQVGYEVGRFADSDGKLTGLFG